MASYQRLVTLRLRPGQFQPLRRFIQRALTFLLTGSLAVSLTAADWPMYRADAARSGYTSEPLPPELNLQWTHRSPQAPRPAWPTAERMQFDNAFQPILIGERVIFGSSADDKVYALDARTGAIDWTFFTGAPIRFAPAGWRDRVFVASDDGWLYALSVSDGRLLWKRRGGFDGQMILGNDRMISHWPARGGPVVFKDTVYFGAGIWPSDGVYLHALNPQNGEPLWVNDDSGGLYLAQPHGGANAKSGVSAQGYLLATEEHVFMPTGRAVPAAFHRTDGKFAYYHLQKNQQRGGTWAMVADQFLLNAGQLFKRTNGEAKAGYGEGPVAATPNGLVQASTNGVAAYLWKELERTDRKGKRETYRGVEKYSEVPHRHKVLEVIVTGEEAVLGGDNRVTIVNFVTGQDRWLAHVQGKAIGLAFAGGRLVVATDTGMISCYAADKPTRQKPARLAKSSAVSAANRGASPHTAMVGEIIKKTGVTEGFCVDLGASDIGLAMELARRTKLNIYVVQPDAAKVEQDRKLLDVAGLNGVRVTVHQGDPAKTFYPRMFADLVISSSALTNAWEITDEARRLQRPFGGVICVGQAGNLKIDRRGPLAGVGSWTHQNADPANTLCSNDQQVKGPLKMLWFRDVDFEIANRHGQGPSPLYNKGFMVVEGVDGVCALNAYNGRTLWTYPIMGILKEYDGIHHDVGVGDTGGNFCLSDDSVYVRMGDRCLRLDLATGRKLAEYKTPVPDEARNRAWGYLGFSNGLLYGSVDNEEHTVSPRYEGIRLFTESVLFFALDPKTGKVKWQYQPKESIRHNAIAIGGGRVYLIDRVLAMEDRITNPEPNGKHRPRLKPGEHPGGVLLALDARTGTEIWRQAEDIYGTQLALSEKHGVLLMNYQAVLHNFFRLPSEVGDRLSGFDAATGRRLWDRAATYVTRPVINDEVIYAQGGAWNLKTGDEVPFRLNRSHGCGQISASSNLMLFRSATLGYVDLTRGSGTENFGGLRPGCWISVIPAGGLVLVPDGSAKCKCSYQMQAWMALQPGE